MQRRKGPIVEQIQKKRMLSIGGAAGQATLPDLR
jgi:hypothetical protein